MVGIQDSETDKLEKPVLDRLLHVAGEIFAEKGHSATVREICTKAQCSVAAINYYFGDKQRLYIRCVQEACEQKGRKFPLAGRESDDGVQDWPAELRRFLHTIAQRMMAKSNVSWQSTLMLREVISPSEGVAEILEEPFKRDFEVLTNILSRLLGAAAKDATLVADFATQTLARCMFLRTGHTMREILGLQGGSNREPLVYADTVCESLLLQINQVRLNSGQTPLDLSSKHNQNIAAAATKKEVQE